MPIICNTRRGYGSTGCEIQTYMYNVQHQYWAETAQGRKRKQEEQILKEETASIQLCVCHRYATLTGMWNTGWGTFQYIPVKSETRTIESADVGWEVCKSHAWILCYIFQVMKLVLNKNLWQMCVSLVTSVFKIAGFKPFILLLSCGKKCYRAYSISGAPLTSLDWQLGGRYTTE